MKSVTNDLGEMEAAATDAERRSPATYALAAVTPGCGGSRRPGRGRAAGGSRSASRIAVHVACSVDHVDLPR
jgi:hypothetical protein